MGKIWNHVIKFKERICVEKRENLSLIQRKRSKGVYSGIEERGIFDYHRLHWYFL